MAMFRTQGSTFNNNDTELEEVQAVTELVAVEEQQQEGISFDSTIEHDRYSIKSHKLLIL
jgi:hypothetical protein